MMEIRTKIENGKAYLQFEFPSEYREAGGEAVLLQVKDREGREVLNCLYPLSEEEPAGGILLHPHLWNGAEEPYLYNVEAHFMNKACEIMKSIYQPLALYALEEIQGKGLFLNGKLFEVRAVNWDVEVTGEHTVKILELLRRMGANTICLPDEQKGNSEELLQLCSRTGFLVKELETSAPACSELFSLRISFVTDIYYRYKAKWSKESFVHICMSSIKKQENGNFELTVFSNQKKIALYVNGALFEFRNGGEEYYFEEIPVKKYPAVLTAEAGECNTAVTIYEGSQIFHRNVTFS